MLYTLSHKDLLELKYWITCDRDSERAKSVEYLRTFGINEDARWNVSEETRHLTSILEIGTGPNWGVLPYLHADRKVAVDPLIEAYNALGILDERSGIQYYSEPFDLWDTDARFDAIFCLNALDHGQMGFHLLPKMALLLKPNGLLFIYVQLRRKDQLNLIHDHALNSKQYADYLLISDIKELDVKILPRDVEPPHCPALVGVWKKWIGEQ